MTIALVMCPPWGVDTPPLTVAYLTACARSWGHDVHPVDLNFELYNSLNAEGRRFWGRGYLRFWKEQSICKRLEPLLARFADALVAKLIEKKIKIIGFSVPAAIAVPLYLAQRVKASDPSIVTILGGSCCERERDGRSLIRDEHIDALVVGEGEESLREIIENVFRTGRVGRVAGALSKSPSGIIDGGSRPHVDLNDYPDPDYSDYPLSDYWRIPRLADRQDVCSASTDPDLHADHEPVFQVESSRGCSQNCAFCGVRNPFGSLRRKDPERVVAHIADLKRRYDAKRVYIVDPSLNGDIKHLEQMSALLARRNLGVRWGGRANISEKLTAEMLRKMWEGGCRKLSFGVETGSIKVARAMRKPYGRISTVRRNLRDAKATGMDVSVFLMVGFPGEGWREFCETLLLLWQNRKVIDSALTATTVIPPTSELFKNPQQFGVVFDFDEIRRDPSKWRTLDGNTPSTRNLRFIIVQLVLFGSGIKGELSANLRRLLWHSWAEASPGASLAPGQR